MKRRLSIVFFLVSFFSIAQKTDNCQIVPIKDKEEFRAIIINLFKSDEYSESQRQFDSIRNGIQLLIFTEGMPKISCFNIDIDKMKGWRMDNLENKKLSGKDKDSFYQEAQKIDETNYLEICPQYGHLSTYWMILKKDNTILGEYCVSSGSTKPTPRTEAAYIALEKIFDWVVRLYYK